jgi:AraC family L-rhamnose operon transcriptional activator RhaR/AraC family L-rhamnose operon regulatory protein RhaS
MVRVYKYKKKDFLCLDNFPIGVYQQDPQPACPAHRHQFSELVVVLAGSGIHVIEEEEYPVSKHDIFVITDDSWHTYRDLNNLVLANVIFDPVELEMAHWDVRALPGYHGMFEPSGKERHGFHSRLKLNDLAFETIKALVNKLKAELAERNPGFELMAKSIFAEIVIFLSRCYSRPQMRISASLQRVEGVIKYIEENYSEDINIDSLAKVAYMSRRNLGRVFREAIGQSPIEYLIRVRVTHSLELLRNPDFSITDVAFRVGFNDSNYFSRQFKKTTGQTPREFRSHDMSEHIEAKFGSKEDSDSEQA